MSWVKSIKRDDNGAVATYWEVVSIFYEHKTQSSLLVVGGWVDEEAYNSSLEPLITKSWDVPAGLAPDLSVGALQFVTSYALAQPEFDGAIEEGE